MQFTAQNLTDIISLDSGFTLTVANALAAAVTGTSKSQLFTVPERPGGGDRTLTLSAVPNGTTALIVDVEVSSDGGASFQKKVVGLALITASVSTQAIVNNVQPGLIYRINPTTNTAGTACTVNASAA